MKLRPKTADSLIRDHVAYLLEGGGAHLSFDSAFADVPEEFRAAKPPGLSYTPWRLLEHMRIAQADILDFCRNPNYTELPFPEGYWPAGDGPANPADWYNSQEAFHRDLQAMVDLVRDLSTDLFAHIPWGGGQTFFREALLVADHNSYHLGQMVVIRTLLGIETDGV